MSRVPSVVTPSPVELVATLEDRWDAAMAPREANAPTVASLFAGGGGSSLGYLMAGFRETVATDHDPVAMATFRQNLLHVPTWEGDIAELTADAILEQAGLASGELDVLDGSPPCQGFSMAGRRQLSDSRNTLFREYVRLLANLQPRVFVMENVAGMVRGRMRLVFADCLLALKAAGYRVSARVLNAMYFGVPQHRARLIVIGVRADLGMAPTHPAATTWPIPIRTALAAAARIGGQPGDAATPELTDSYGLLWPQVRPGQSAMHVIGKGYSSCVKPHPDRPCPTLMKTQKGTGFATIVHPSEQRPLTIREAATIGAYPPAFRFTGTYQEQWGRIGNSVPPFFMQAIASHLRTAILDQLKPDQVQAA
ncbi:MAG: DNA cytosine methyltransferase [Thermomicrobiales bacterium]